MQTNDSIIKNNVPKYKGKNFFIGGIQKRADKAKAEGWSIKCSRRDFKCPQTVISSTFFNTFLELGDKCLQIVPPKKDSSIDKSELMLLKENTTA